MHTLPTIPPHQCFAHEAMHTTFTLRLHGAPPAQLENAARDCFERIDQLENRLSRFIETSEISRINTLQAGETLYLSDACHRCLLTAIQASQETLGLFDITLGSHIESLKNNAPLPSQSPTGQLSVHPDAAAVTCISPGRQLDLGGIGKGFALDELLPILTEWDIPSGLLASGNSTLLAFGDLPWPVELITPNESLILSLQQSALGASGTEMQGAHILHPDLPSTTPSYLSDRVWITAPTAAMADAWSTALMLMQPAEAAEILAHAPSVLEAHADLNGRLTRLKPLTPTPT